MGIRPFIGILALSTIAVGADLDITVDAGKLLERRFAFTKEDLRDYPIFWVEADPNRIRVSITAPDGREYDANNGESEPIHVQIADSNSDSWDESTLAQVLDDDGILVTLKPDAPVGTYTVHFAGVNLSSPVQLKLHQMTADAAGKEFDVRARARDRRLLATVTAEQSLKSFDEPPTTVHLLHNNIEDPDEQGYMDTIVDRPIVIHLVLTGGRSPISAVKVTGIIYLQDHSTAPAVRVIGPDPSKKAYGMADNVTREPNGEFVYTFSAQVPGIHQVDFKATGTFQNGRRFSADGSVTIFAHPKAATLTRVRQQRVGPNLVRFLLDLDVAEPGPYEAYIQVGKEPNQRELAYGERVLLSGMQTLIAEGDAAFVAKLAEDAKAQLDIMIESKNQPEEGNLPSKVVMNIATPKAGDLEP